MKKPIPVITKLLLLSVISILTSPILFAQPYTHVEEKESYYAKMILTGYPERDSSFAKRLSLSNEVIKGLEYIIFCKQSEGELSFYVNHRMSFLNRHPENKNMWTGLCGLFYTSLERLQNHLSQFPDIKLMNPDEDH